MYNFPPIFTEILRRSKIMSITSLSSEIHSCEYLKISNKSEMCHKFIITQDYLLMYYIYFCYFISFIFDLKIILDRNISIRYFSA